jgi:hypothetical protein
MWAVIIYLAGAYAAWGLAFSFYLPRYEDSLSPIIASGVRALLGAGALLLCACAALVMCWKRSGWMRVAVLVWPLQAPLLVPALSSLPPVLAFVLWGVISFGGIWLLAAFGRRHRDAL